MVSKSHHFLGLAADADTFASFRMSFLMDASKVLVGTFLSIFFRPSSNGVLL
jgi:hypothetical protein